MLTANKTLLNTKENKKYYSQSDGNFMPLSDAMYAHRVIDRVAWLREWVHKLKSRTHIDFGCKDGYTCLTLQAEGVSCIGIDPSKDAIDEAKFKGSRMFSDATFVVDYAEDFNKDIFADTVSCMEVIEHVVDPVKLLSNICKYGRYVAITTPYYYGRHGIKDASKNKEHIRIYKKKELIKLIEPFAYKILECVVRDDQICIIFEVN